MAHISRRELKSDEFRDTMEHGLETLATHKRTIWLVSALVVLAALAIFGWRYYSSHQNAQASAAFAQAMRVYNIPVQTSGQPPMPGQQSYASDAVKYAAVQKEMGAVAMRFPHTRYGQMARYYAAVSLDRLGRYQDAVNWLLPMTKGNGQMQALAKRELAHVYDRMGKPALALPLLVQLLAKPSVFVPKPVVLLALGDHYRAQNQAQQAAKYYQQLKTEFPNTGLADQASQRLEMLGKS